MAIWTFFQPNVNRMRAGGDVPGLTKALAHSNRMVRLSASAALRDLGGEASIGPLMAALADDYGLVRLNAVEGLQRIGGHEPRRRSSARSTVGPHL